MPAGLLCVVDAIEPEVEPVADELPVVPELVLWVLGLVLLPLLGLAAVSLRTCLVIGSQHCVVLLAVAPPGAVEGEVCAVAIPTVPASTAAAAISAVLVIGMRCILLLPASPRMLT